MNRDSPLNRSAQAAHAAKTVFLFDVDNTLLDNDRVIADLRRHLESAISPQAAKRYWAIFEAIRDELGYADYLGALQRFRSDSPHDPRLYTVSYFLLNYPFAERLFPGALDAVRRTKEFGPVVILTDGDVVFQPHKIRRSGLFDAFSGNILIYVHKEDELADVERHFPAAHYVMVDDKIRILAAIKNTWDSRVTTVFVKEGHYAHDLAEVAKYPPADVSLNHIAELATQDFANLRPAAAPGRGGAA